MGLILDTSVLIAWERTRAQLQAFAEREAQEPVALSVITAAELLHGIHRADTAARRNRRSAYVEQILARFPLIIPSKTSPPLIVFSETRMPMIPTLLGK